VKGNLVITIKHIRVKMLYHITPGACRSKRGATLPPLDFTQPGQAATQQQTLAAPLAYLLRGKQLAALLPAAICQVGVAAGQRGGGDGGCVQC
jgi:hypothetical protein